MWVKMELVSLRQQLHQPQFQLRLLLSLPPQLQQLNQLLQRYQHSATADVRQMLIVSDTWAMDTFVIPLPTCGMLFVV